jgi:hypothetical protein
MTIQFRGFPRLLSAFDDNFAVAISRQKDSYHNNTKALKGPVYYDVLSIALSPWAAKNKSW